MGWWASSFVLRSVYTSMVDDGMDGVTEVAEEGFLFITERCNGLLYVGFEGVTSGERALTFTRIVDREKEPFKGL